jgi:hypothetical protein
MTALALGQPARNFWQLPAGTPDWMRPPDWLALGGKLVGMMYDEKLKQWVPVEASAGLGNPGKIVGFNPDTGEMYYAMALAAEPPAGQASTLWALAAAAGFVGLLMWIK